MKANGGGPAIDYKGNVIGLVYFLRTGRRGPIKIGFSTNLEKRLNLFKCGNPSVQLIGAIQGTVHDERKWHLEYADLRLRGEWFAPAPRLTERIEQETHFDGFTAAPEAGKSRSIPERRGQIRKKLILLRWLDGQIISV